MIRWNSWLRRAPSRHTLVGAKRCLSAQALDGRLSDPVQSYVSTSDDPYLNLSIEHYLLQKSAPESAILFLYVNRPSIIIGRNQNPWLEVNLELLNQSRKDQPETEPPGLGVVDLVRRRSGGGTVFHDEGNVNWTVICPSAKFTRDKHAEMVVRALRERGIDRARVNERHDIVLDQGEYKDDFDPKDTHSTAYTDGSGSGSRPLKVSGSAYKLTRNRALHHGTCLLSSPNLNIIPHYLHSPAKPYITARGVESVSSPVSNVLLGNEDFMKAVQHQYGMQYHESGRTKPEELGQELLNVKSITDGFKELRSLDWTYLQTPQFTISNKSDADSLVDLELTVRHGAIVKSAIERREGSGDANTVELGGADSNKLHRMSSWDAILEKHALDMKEGKDLAEWLHRIIPIHTES